MRQVVKTEVDETVSGSCLKADFGIMSVKISGSVTTLLDSTVLHTTVL
jgi:hypothetical protein